MSSERELRLQFQNQRDVLRAWGEHVRETVLSDLRLYLLDQTSYPDIETFLKIPAMYRVKEEASFVAKALHRGKKYTDPLRDITDQVGVRFVVLLGSETEILDRIIKKRADWEIAQDRDYEQERIYHPHSFDYESNHYVVRLRHPLRIGEIDIPTGLPCEVQVRTLLQHAYAELSHDRLYKPECKVPDKVRRLVARGSALLETTDHMFCEVSRSLEEVMRALRSSHDAARDVAVAHGINLRSDDPQLSLVLLRQWGDGATVSRSRLEDFIREKDYIPRLMGERQAESLFYAHPVGLLGYFWVNAEGRDVASSWPFDRILLGQIAGDLGLGISE